MADGTDSAPHTRELTDLFDQMHVRVRRYMTFLGLSPEDADDGVQEVFLRLHKHLRTQGDRTNLQAWVFQVARNFVRDHRKSARVRRSVASGEDAAGLSAVAATGDSPEERLLKEEKLRWLQSAMERLTPQQIECLQLRVAGLRYKEIADVMGIGISAVGELVQRATIRLSEDFNG